MKKRTFIATIAVAIIAGVSIFVACTKEEKNNISHVFTNKNLPTSIPYYADYDELISVINTASSFESIEELNEYELQLGRQSIGALSDMFFENIDYTLPMTHEDAFNMCIQNSDILDIEIDDMDTVITPKWHNSPYRYAANHDGYFAVGDYVYRIFDTCVVGCSADNYDYIVTLGNTTDFTNLDSSIYKIEVLSNYSQLNNEHGSCATNRIYSDYEVDGDDKITMALAVFSGSLNFIGSVITPRLYFYSTHKWAGCWWTSRRTLYVYGNVKIHREISTGNWVTDSYDIDFHKKINIINYPIYLYPVTTGRGLSHLHYFSFNVTGYSLNVCCVNLTH